MNAAAGGFNVEFTVLIRKLLKLCYQMRLFALYMLIEFLFLFDFVIVCLLMLHDLILKALLCYYLHYVKQYVLIF